MASGLELSSNFRLSAVHGMLYTGGNTKFDPSNASQPVLLSPVRNHLTKVQLVSGATSAHTVCNSTLQCFDLSSDGDLAVAVGNRGLAIFYSFSAQLPLDSISFPPHCRIISVRFSPCNKYVALGLDSTLQVYAAPATRTVSFHSSPPLLNWHNCLSQQITHIEWTRDSQHLLVSGADANIKIVPRLSRHRKGLVAAQNHLSGHRKPVIGAFFAPTANSLERAGENGQASRIVSVAQDNCVILWIRSATTRQEVMAVVHAQKRQLRRLGASHRPRPHRRGGDDDESSDDEKGTTEIGDDGGGGRAPESFFEKSRRLGALAAEGAAANGTTVDEDIAAALTQRGDDAYLADVIRYVYDMKKKFILKHDGDISAVAYHEARGVLALGYTSGIFVIHVLDELNQDLPALQELSVSSQALTALSFSVTGDYVAVASEALKQLIVWDWKASSYVLKEQSHYYDVNVAAFNIDGSVVVTGGEEGKVKLWNASSGQALVTFTEHVAGVTGIAFSHSTNAVFTCSKDGTVRAFDTTRYRNFRVFHPAQPTQFNGITVDPSGEVVAASSNRSSTVTLWAVQTGKIIEEFTGHEGPVSCVAFHPSGTTLITCGATDKTMMVWDVFTTSDEGERLRHRAESVPLLSDAVSVSCSWNGRRMAILLHNGDVMVWDVVDPKEPALIHTFSTVHDAAGGWQGRVGPNTKNADVRFTHLAMSPEGDRVLLSGDCRWIALYHSTQGFLLAKWPVTSNLDMEGAVEQFDYRNMSEGGFMINDVDVDPDDAQLRSAKLLELPGANHRHFATGKRKTKLVARSMDIAFAAHGRDFIAATTDGLLHYSLSHHRTKFSPLQLTSNLTPKAVQHLLDDGKFTLALAGALLLRDPTLATLCFRRTPASGIAIAVSSAPTRAFHELVRWVAIDVETTVYTEQALTWAQTLLLQSEEPLFGPRRDVQVGSALRLLHRAIAAIGAPLRDALKGCAYTAAYIDIQCSIGKGGDAAAAAI